VLADPRSARICLAALVAVIAMFVIAFLPCCLFEVRVLPEGGTSCVKLALVFTFHGWEAFVG
jgi:hypothetical protein